MIVTRHVAEVLVLEQGAVRRTETQLEDERRHDGYHRQNDTQAEPNETHDAGLIPAGIGIVGPLLLFGQDGLETLPARRLHLREPGGREGYTRLGELLRAHARHVVVHVVALNLHAGVERAMAPSAHVLLGDERRAFRGRQIDVTGDVVGRHVPAVRDELPVQLARIRPSPSGIVIVELHPDPHLHVVRRVVDHDLEAIAIV